MFSLNARLQDCSPSFYHFSVLVHIINNAPGHKSIGIEYCQKNKLKSIANIHFNTAYKKYRRYIHQYSKSTGTGNTIGSNSNTTILKTLLITISSTYGTHILDNYIKGYNSPEILLSNLK